jgi:hypothetical protein
LADLVCSPFTWPMLWPKRLVYNTFISIRYRTKQTCPEGALADRGNLDLSIAYGFLGITYWDNRPIRRSFRLDACRLDDRPPFVDFGLLVAAQRFGRLLLHRKNLLCEVDKFFARLRIGQRFDQGII